MPRGEGLVPSWASAPALTSAGSLQTALGAAPRDRDRDRDRHRETPLQQQGRAGRGRAVEGLWGARVSWSRACTLVQGAGTVKGVKHTRTVFSPPLVVLGAGAALGAAAVRPGLGFTAWHRHTGRFTGRFTPGGSKWPSGATFKGRASAELDGSSSWCRGHTGVHRG